MPGIVTPPTIVEPFGVNAAPSLITLPIPVASQIGITGGAASYNDGFPPVTFLAEVAGGIPPLGQDFNGILYTITAHLAAISAGQPYLYNATIAAAIGGYPVGTILGSADGTAAWISTTNGNVSDPDGGAPAGWVAIYAYGQGVVAGLTNANVTLSPAQYKKPFIFLSGALTGNVRIIFPTTAQKWLIINNCTGAFAVTATTAGGSGVAIPAGGPSSPTGIYCDGANIQPSTAPLAVPISIGPAPLTLVERDNGGYVYATYFNQNSNSAENPTIGAIFVENNGADGYLRKVTPGSFTAQLGLATTTAMNAAIAAAIAAALAAYSTTTAMNAAIAAALAAYSTTTAMNAAIAAAIAALPKVKSGIFNSVNGVQNVVFPSAFATVPKVVAQWNYAGPTVGWVVPGSITINGFQYQNASAGTMNYIAVGT